MKCKNFEQDIYLYSELSESERIRIDSHIRECPKCKELFQHVSLTQTLIIKAASAKLEPNHGRLTSNIIQAVKHSKNKTLFFSLNNLFLRYAMGAASLALIAAFIVEQQSEVSLQKKTPIAETVTLKSSSAAEIIRDKKQPELSLYACIKSETCVNTLFENLKQKKF